MQVAGGPLCRPTPLPTTNKVPSVEGPPPPPPSPPHAAGARCKVVCAATNYEYIKRPALQVRRLPLVSQDIVGVAARFS